MEMGFVRGVIAVVTLGLFLGICWWAYRPGNKQRFERDAMLPFDEDENDRSASTDAHGGSLR